MKLLAVVFALTLCASYVSADFADAARRAVNPRKDDALYHNPHVDVEKGRNVATGAALVSSNFAASDEGWMSWTPAGTTGSVTFSSGMISISSTGSNVVYFSSPSSWQGDRSAAYNGKLSFKSGPTSSSGSAITSNTIFDVALVAKCGYALTLTGVLQASATQTYSLSLHEDAGWIDSRTEKKAGMFDFLGVLANLDSVRIRAASHTGDEGGALYDASLLSGKQWHPCCTLDDTVDVCASAGAPYYNPSTLKFYCEGSLAQPVRVKRVYPRFARRTGGARITVEGENFGLEGATPIVRVGNMMCQRTWYPGVDSPTSNNKGPDQETVLHCTSPVNQGFDQGVTVESASGSIDSPYQVRQAGDRTRWEVKEATATSCLSDDTHGFEFGAHDFTWAVGVNNKVPSNSYGHPVGADRNSGDMYLVVSSEDTSAATDVKVMADHIQAADDMKTTCSQNEACEILYKFSKDGSPLWVALIKTEAAANAALDITSIFVDESTAPTSIYLAGVYTTSATNINGLKVYPGSGKLNTVASWSGQSSLTLPASTALTPVAQAGVGILIRYDADGIVKFARPIVTDSATGVQAIRMSAYRPSTSLIINHHTQGDEPSSSYILGKNEANGGVYLVGEASVANTKKINFGDEPAAYKGTAALDKVEMTSAGAYFTPFLAKYDSDGHCVWARLLGRQSNALGLAASKVNILDVAAGNNLAFAAVKVTASTLYADSCMFASKIEGQNGDLSENRLCTFSSAAHTSTLEGSSFSGAYIIAFSAAGEVKWSQKQTTSASSVSEMHLGWARPFRGGRPLTGNTQHWDNHESLLGRHQPDMGRVNDVGSESRDEMISDGTWLYAVTSVGLGSGAAGITVAGTTFPEVSPPANAAAATGAANEYVTMVAKYMASTGTPQWASSLTWNNAAGDNGYSIKASDVAVDDQTGAVYVAGHIKNIGANGANTVEKCNEKDNANDPTKCGADIFGIHNAADLNRVGCPADPRREINSQLCRATTATTRSHCANGLYFKEFGRAYCRFMVNGKDETGFVAKINEAYQDPYRRTQSAAFGNVGTLVEWFKYLGRPTTDRFGATLNEDAAKHNKIVGGQLAIHDSDVFVSGQATKIQSAATAINDGSAVGQNIYKNLLRFEGVHSTNVTELSGLHFGASAKDVAFVAKLED